MQSSFPFSIYHRGVVVLVALAMLCWAFLLWSMANMDAPFVQLMMPEKAAWSVPEITIVWLMWAVMMGAMMLPSAMPMILVHRRFASDRTRPSDVPSSNRWFAFAYVMVWSVFSVAAAGIQWGLQAAGTLSPMLAINNRWLVGVLLIMAGVVQWTPLKHACLEKCRTPIGFLTTEWRDGDYGAFVMGLRHGTYCVGCCWALMALLFVFGVMNLVAIVVLTTIVAAEKLLPYGDHLARIGGVILVVWGAWILAA